MPTLLTVAIYATFSISFVAYVVGRLRVGIGLREIIPRVALILVCGFSYSIGPQVEGLEYEDAYVHGAAGVWRAHHLSESSDGFYTTVCFAGSATDCVAEGTFGTQLIGFSTLIALMQHVVGDLPHLGNALSALASILSLQIVWSMLTRYAPAPIGRLVAVGLLLTATSFYLISGSGFAEPLFTFFLLLYLYCYLQLTNARGTSEMGWPLWGTFITSGALMILTKKEGALLVVVTLLFEIFNSWREPPRKQDTLIAAQRIVLISIGLLLYSYIVLRIGDAADRHSVDIGEAAFRLSNLANLLPVFLSAASSPKYFGLMAAMFTLTLPVTLYFRDRIAIQLTCVVVGYVLIYSFHARHQAYVHGAAVDPAEMIRYVYALAPVVAVLVGRNLSQLILASKIDSQALRPVTLRLLVGSAFSLGLVATAFNLRNQRIDMAADERLTRTGVIDQEKHSESANAIYVTPYAAALIAVGRAGIVVVDSSVVRDPAVEKWLEKKVANGATLVVDQQLCNEPAPSEWIATCKMARQLQRIQE